MQFLNADEVRPQRLLEIPTQVDGLHIAQISGLILYCLAAGNDGEETTIEHPNGHRRGARGCRLRRSVPQ